MISDPHPLPMDQLPRAVKLRLHLIHHVTVVHVALRDKIGSENSVLGEPFWETTLFVKTLEMSCAVVEPSGPVYRAPINTKTF